MSFGLEGPFSTVFDFVFFVMSRPPFCRENAGEKVLVPPPRRTGAFFGHQRRERGFFSSRFISRPTHLKNTTRLTPMMMSGTMDSKLDMTHSFFPRRSFYRHGRSA
jgi:hypothetical protein